MQIRNAGMPRTSQLCGLTVTAEDVDERTEHSGGANCPKTRAARPFGQVVARAGDRSADEKASKGGG